MDLEILPNEIKEMIFNQLDLKGIKNLRFVNKELRILLSKAYNEGCWFIMDRKFASTIPRRFKVEEDVEWKANVKVDTSCIQEQSLNRFVDAVKQFFNTYGHLVENLKIIHLRDSFALSNSKINTLFQPVLSSATGIRQLSMEVDVFQSIWFNNGELKFENLTVIELNIQPGAGERPRTASNLQNAALLLVSRTPNVDSFYSTSFSTAINRTILQLLGQVREDLLWINLKHIGCKNPMTSAFSSSRRNDLNLLRSINRPLETILFGSIRRSELNQMQRVLNAHKSSLVLIEFRPQIENGYGPYTWRLPIMPNLKSLRFIQYSSQEQTYPDIFNMIPLFSDENAFRAKFPQLEAIHFTFNFRTFQRPVVSRFFDPTSAATFPQIRELKVNYPEDENSQEYLLWARQLLNKFPNVRNNKHFTAARLAS